MRVSLWMLYSDDLLCEHRLGQLTSILGKALVNFVASIFKHLVLRYTQTKWKFKIGEQSFNLASNKSFRSVTLKICHILFHKLKISKITPQTLEAPKTLMLLYKTKLKYRSGYKISSARIFGKEKAVSTFGR